MKHDETHKEEINLFVDDLRNPPSGLWVVARTFDEAVELLDSCTVLRLALDYNLGDDTFRFGKTGLSVLEYIFSRMKRGADFILPEITTHSSDPRANERMADKIQDLIALSRLPIEERKRF